MFIRLLWENSQTFGMCGDLKKKEKMMLFKARVSKASRYSFSLNLRQNKKGELLCYSPAERR